MTGRLRSEYGSGFGARRLERDSEVADRSGWYRLASRMFARNAVHEDVATQAQLHGTPEAVWDQLMFYEEVPGHPPLLLRLLLTHPIRCEGDKTRVGTTVRCAYRSGDLVKRIIAVQPPHFLSFEVIEQRLGIETCILTRGGSYEIRACGNETNVVLITNYQTYLRPRWLWRPLEMLVVSQLHNHILRGVGAGVVFTNPVMRLGPAGSLAPQSIPSGGFACTASQSCSRR